MTDEENGSLDDINLDDQYLADIDYLTRMVQTGADLIEEGNEINLSNLETAVAELCGRMAEHPPTESGPITEAIENLVERLGALGEALKRQNEQRH